MRTWTRAANFTLCGLCGGHIRIGAPLLLISWPGLPKPKRRGECCAGPAPPDLPEKIVAHSTTKAMKPLAKMAREYLLYPND